MMKRLSFASWCITLGAMLALPASASAWGSRPPRFYANYPKHMPHSMTHAGSGYAGGVFPNPYAFSFVGPYNDYGPFTGARHDEERLLHLGGEGPYTGTPDIITLIEGRRLMGGYWHP